MIFRLIFLLLKQGRQNLYIFSMFNSQYRAYYVYGWYFQSMSLYKLVPWLYFRVEENNLKLCCVPAGVSNYFASQFDKGGQPTSTRPVKDAWAAISPQIVQKSFLKCGISIKCHRWYRVLWWLSVCGRIERRRSIWGLYPGYVLHIYYEFKPIKHQTKKQILI